MIKNFLRLFFLFFIVSIQPINAQDSLLTVLTKKEIPSGEKQLVAFNSPRIINAQTTETLRKRNFDFRIAHRFGNFLSSENNTRGGFHSFYGLDDPRFDIRIAFEYGVTDNFMVGFSRSKHDENLEALIKYCVLKQTADNKIPVSIAIFGSSAYTPKRDPIGVFHTTSDRFLHTLQIIIGRKFSSKLSFELIPSLVHRNIINPSPDDRNLFSIGGGGGWKITKHFTIIADYFYNFRKTSLKDIYYNPLSAGVEIVTGGHVFSIMFTNAQYIIEPGFIANTTDSWTKNGWKLSFNISRIFRF